MDIVFNNDTINAIDLKTSLGKYCPENPSEPFLTSEPIYYRTLAHLSTYFEDSILFDIGRGYGFSALALSYNPFNTVYSFDVPGAARGNQVKDKGNIYFYEKAAGADLNLINAKLIYIDINHDAITERELYYLLVKNNYKGIVIMDDILDYPELKEFWDEIKTEKYDITNYGHKSGFGLINFNPEVKIILE